MKIVHAADIHLDSPLRGLERYEGAPVEQIRGATRRATESLVELCITEGASLLLIAGDLYDGNWRDYNTCIFFVAQMARLRAAEIPVVLIRGNHDAASQITRSLRMPENVTELPTHRAETKLFPQLSVAVHGQGFANKSVTDDLASGYPEALPGHLNIGLLHTSMGGREGHETYAPCTLEALARKGYDYWALGHVHKREIVSRDPWVVFPGNLQGRHAKETGAKGASIITIDGGRITSVKHRPLDAVRWCLCEVDLTGASSADDAVDLAREALGRRLEEADGRPVAARVVLQGTSRAHSGLQAAAERYSQQIRAAALDIVGEGLWVEKILLRTRTPIQLDALEERDDAIGQLARSLRALRTDDEELAGICAKLADLRQKLPQEAREGEDGLRLDDPADVRAMLDDVEQMLIPRLLQSERGA